MTHTSTVQLVLDSTRCQGTLYHSLTESLRARISTLGHDYMMAHATGRVRDAEALAADIRDLAAR